MSSGVTRPVRLIVIGVITMAIVTSSFLAGFAAASSWWSSSRSGTATAAGGKPAEQPGDSQLQVIEEVWGIVERDYYKREGIDPDKMKQEALGGLLKTLNDPYTFYASPGEAKIFDEDLQGRFGGIGVAVEMKEGKLVVVAPREGSPGAMAGLRPGDIIVAVNGQPIKSVNLWDAIARIRGPAGTGVSLTIQREGLPEPFTVEIVRAEIRENLVEQKVLEGGFAYLRVAVFGDVMSELKEAIKSILDGKAKGLVLDLRNNNGGYLNSAVEALSQFLGDGVALYEKGRDGKEEPITVQPGGLATTIPLVVLVNGGTASASEIVAAALQYYRRAVVIGERTFGKGTVQNIYDLNDGSRLRVTVAEWLTPSHQELDKSGLTPDIIVESPPAGAKDGNDPQLAKALEYLRGLA